MKCSGFARDRLGTRAATAAERAAAGHKAPSMMSDCAAEAIRPDRLCCSNMLRLPFAATPAATRASARFAAEFSLFPI